jgi:5-methylcytosine-specific restriction enzyme A
MPPVAVGHDPIDIEPLKPKRKKRRKVGKLSRLQKDRVMARDNWKCRKCGSQDDLTIDHRRAVVNGGTNAMSNLQTLCWPCNQAKGTESDGKPRRRI